ncbi:hypothetical protein V5799_013293 [Amblyomma americanum]|uniref:Protein kinase domain-containing protein n=1 Tax=Amblyomma americanum TaxID=6943 RepID=A0AAQ4E6C2_AMBAM
MAETFQFTEREASEHLCHKDDELHTDDDDADHLALSDAIAKSILESEEWPSYVERLRQVGDDDEHIEELLRAERPCQQYPVWHAHHAILENAGTTLPPGEEAAAADLPSSNLQEHTELQTTLQVSVRADDSRDANASQLFPDLSRSSISDPQQGTCFKPDHSTKSSSRSVFLSSPFTPLKKLDIIEEDVGNRESKRPSPYNKPPQGTPAVMASRFALGRSKSRKSETGSRGTTQSKNSPEWSPDIEQLRGSFVSSGSSGEGDLFKSSFRISKSGSSILALERLFLEAFEASSQAEFCMAASKDQRFALPGTSAQRQAGASCTTSKGLPLQRLGRGAFGRVFGVQIKAQVVRLRARPKFGEDDGVPELRELVKRCWSHESDERPSVGAVLLELSALHKETLKSRAVPG